MRAPFSCPERARPCRASKGFVEGDRPGNSYYAAELRGDIDAANRAAEAAGLRVRFVKG